MVVAIEHGECKSIKSIPIPRKANNGSAAAHKLADQLMCNFDTPCFVTPSDYSSDYVVWPLSNVSFNIAATNGNVQFYLGPDADHYWGDCCGPNGDSTCMFDGNQFGYNATCLGDKPVPMVMSMQSDNYAEADPVVIQTNYESCTLGVCSTVFCNLFVDPKFYCPQ